MYSHLLSASFTWKSTLKLWKRMRLGFSSYNICTIYSSEIPQPRLVSRFCWRRWGKVARSISTGRCAPGILWFLRWRAGKWVARVVVSIFYLLHFLLYLGKRSNLTNVLQLGLNHQLGGLRTSCHNLCWEEKRFPDHKLWIFFQTIRHRSVSFNSTNPSDDLFVDGL